MINLGKLVTEQSERSPWREALVEPGTGRRWTYSEYNAGINKAANMFLDLGVTPGDRVAILMQNSIEFMQSFFALAKIGAIVVPLNWRLQEKELEFLIGDAKPKVLVYHDVYSERVQGLDSVQSIQHLVQVNGTVPDGLLAFLDAIEAVSDSEPEIGAFDDDDLFIMYSSGTTGRPKGVVHTHRSILWSLLSNIMTVDYRVSDRYLLTMPMFHIGALLPAVITVYRSMTLVIEREFNPSSFWSLIAAERVTNSMVVPAMLLMLRKNYDPLKNDLSTLRWLLTSAAPISSELIRHYLDQGIGLIQGYGMTEVPAGFMLDPEDAVDQAGSCGKSMVHIDMKIMSEDGSECDVEQPGEIWLRGPQVMKEYWGMPEATEESAEDGWFKTGDVATVNEEGFVSIVGRIKDMIISGGENVYPAELEKVLAGIAGVAEVAVIGATSSRWGESPVAVVVREDERLSEEEIVRYAGQQLAGYKKIVAVRFVDELPRNATGKILKRLLREQFSDLRLP